jgi:hypothetical protein
MPLFQGKNTLKPDSRSRLGALQIGEHTTPSEDWVTDPTLPVILKNPYGGPGMEDVVVPMGRLIAVGEPVKTFTGKFKTKLTLANGTNAVIGVAPYNFCKDNSSADRFGGNNPAVITDKYIRLPYIPASTDSDLCPWGHATGSGITVGDFLKPTAKGQFTKWVEGVDSITQRVGPVLAKDLKQEALGGLKMAMWGENEKYADEIFQNYYNKISSPDALGYGYVPEYKEGLIDMEKYGYMNQFQKTFTGIPGLTDGSGRQLTRVVGQNVGTIEAYSVDTAKQILQIKDNAGGSVINVQISDKPEIKAVVYKNGVAIAEGTTPGTYSIKHSTGQITYNKKTDNSDLGAVITADFCLHYYGTASYIDFQGSIGVLNILLKL